LSKTKRTLFFSLHSHTPPFVSKGEARVPGIPDFTQTSRVFEATGGVGPVRLTHRRYRGLLCKAPLQGTIRKYAKAYQTHCSGTADRLVLFWVATPKVPYLFEVGSVKPVGLTSLCDFDKQLLSDLSKSYRTTKQKRDRVVYPRVYKLLTLVACRVPVNNEFLRGLHRSHSRARRTINAIRTAFAMGDYLDLKSPIII